MSFFKYLIIYILSLLPDFILGKLENIFSISRGRGFSNPKIEANLITKFALSKNIYLKNIFDVGAFHGDYTNEVIKTFPSSNYYLFEPDNYNFEILKKKFIENNNIKIFKKAISDIEDDGVLYSHVRGSLQASLVNQDLSHFNLENNYRQNIKITSIDKVFDELKIDIIDLCKIDIEGNELKALNGAKDKINKIKLIQFEFGPASVDSSVFFKDFFKFFKKNDFYILRITPSKLVEIKTYDEQIENFRVSNFLAVNKTLV